MPFAAKVLILLIVFLALVIIYVAILVAPGKATTKMKAPFLNRYFAHRGLHTEDDTIPENSLAAFDAACLAGYGIELDVRLTKDGEVVVLHDENLMRPCGVDALIGDLDFDEVADLKLWGTEHAIPLFEEALSTIDGRTPVIVEIKPGDRGEILAKKTMDILAPYVGDYCVESFDPSIVRWVKKYAPVVLRGQLAYNFGEYETNIPLIGRFFASRCMFNMLTRPHFIAYKTGKKPWPVKLTKLLGAMHIVWTSHPERLGGTPITDKVENDAVIFEYYDPPTHY